MSLEDQLRDALAESYRIENELGGGGMSRVFVAEETALGRRVALKVLSEVGGTVSADRFRREIQTVANLQHPHIVPLLSAGSAGSAIWYTMPLVEGESLRARLAREGRLEIRDALQLTREIARALAYAHRRGVVHRDIKPDNVLLTDGHAVVTDFGVAKALSASADATTLTSAGMAIGTPAYMAPEQVLAEPDADHRVDLYALGCLLYEMLAGRPPVTGTTVREVMSAQVTRMPDDVATLRSDVPADVAVWLRRALAKSPGDRWPTADEALADLDACLANLSGERTAAGPDLRTLRIRRWLTAAVVLAVLLGAGAAALLHRGRGAGAATAGPDRIAVMPFIPTDPSDTALARLGRDLVVTLTANLDGIADLRMIDPLSVLAQTQTDAPRDAERASAMAARLGAGSALLGSLVRSGNRVRLDYRLLRTSGGDPTANGVVTASLGDEGIFALTDSATWGMLEAILPSRSGQLPSFELLHTRSIPALRAFLEGENHLLANEWAPAEQAFAKAIEADSTFWFAYRRVVQAADWLFSAGRREREDSIAREHRDAFPERERLLMEFTEHERFSERLAALADITRRFPDYWYGWFQYGDYIAHNGMRLGLTPLDGGTAFDRALELNPRLIPILDHSVMFFQDSTRVEQAYARMREYYGEAWDTVGTNTGVPAPAFYGLPVSRMRNGHVEPAVLATYASDLDHVADVPVVMDFTIAGSLVTFDPQGQIELTRQVRARRPRRAVAESLDRWEGVAWAMRGAWDSALVAFDRVVAKQPTLPLLGARYVVAITAFRSGVIDENEALARRGGLAGYRGTPASENTAHRMLAFLDAMVAHGAKRPAGIDSARAMLRGLQSNGDEYAGFLERELGAFRLDLDGHRDEAADSLTAIEWERGSADRYDYMPVPFIRLAAGQWMAEKGRAATADSLLNYYESLVTNVPAYTVFRQSASLATLERARAWDRAGDAGRAARFYREFLRMYDMPMPAHRPYIEEARSALARITAGG